MCREALRQKLRAKIRSKSSDRSHRGADTTDPLVAACGDNPQLLQLAAALAKQPKPKLDEMKRGLPSRSRTRSSVANEDEEDESVPEYNPS